MFKDKKLRELLGYFDCGWNTGLEKLESKADSERVKELEDKVDLLEEYLSVVKEEVKTNGRSDGVDYIKVSRKEFNEAQSSSNSHGDFFHF